MQRLVKFRAWLYPYKRLIYEFNLFQKNGHFHLWLPGEEFLPDAFELMEYTGLSDKNGKEIWESDIITSFASGNHPMKVCWHYNKWAYSVPNFGYADLNGNVKVIGNIWENKELLEAK